VSWFGFRRAASTHVVADDFVPGQRVLWIENPGEAPLTLTLQPWSDTVEVPPGHHARLKAHVSDDRDEFSVQYQSDARLNVYCPPQTTIAVVEKRP
jgi:hypothetical protein